MSASLLTPIAALLASGLIGVACSSSGWMEQERPRSQRTKQQSPNRTVLSTSRTAPPPPSTITQDAPPIPEASPLISDWQQYVPREPMWLIVAAAGLRNSSFHPEDNRLGLLNWWRGDNAVNNLLDQIDQGYQVGARWFWIDRPMGTSGTSHVPAASWLTIDEKKRAEITTKLNDTLLDKYDEPVHVVWFVGSDMKDPRSIEGWTDRTADEHYKLGGGETWEQRLATRATIGGWISTGASGIGIDNSAHSREREHFIELFHQLVRPPFGLTMYGESFPLLPASSGGPARNADGTVMLSMEHMEQMPWVATEVLIADRWPVTWSPGVASLDVDSTRAFIWLHESTTRYGNPEQRKQRIRRWLDRGLIPITMDAVMFREAKEYMRTN